MSDVDRMKRALAAQRWALLRSRGAGAVLEELEGLDEAVLGRRRLHSEQRRWRRLLRLLDELQPTETEIQS